MKLDPRAMAYTLAALWGGGVLLMGLMNLAVPGYAQAVLELLASGYPGYHAEPTIGSVLVGTGYALVEGFVGGWLLSWLYNRLVKT